MFLIKIVNLMRKKLISELKTIARSIMDTERPDAIFKLKNEVRVLYEKIIVLEAVEAHYGEIKMEAEKSEALRKFEDLASSIITENTQVPENNPHEEDLVMPLMHKIKALVAEMPKEESLEDLLAGIQPNPDFVKKETLENGAETPVSPSRKLSLNDVLNKQLQIGLNDRIGFVKHLFNGTEAEFDKVISHLNTMSSLTEAQNFILNIVKPDYNDWKGKEDYELRLLTLIESRFEA